MDPPAVTLDLVLLNPQGEPHLVLEATSPDAATGPDQRPLPADPAAHRHQREPA